MVDGILGLVVDGSSRLFMCDRLDVVDVVEWEDGEEMGSGAI